MANIILFFGAVVIAILNLIVFVMFANAIISWLVAFNVINLRNRFVYQIVHALDAMTQPLLRPLRRIIPPFGGLDLTPLVYFIGIPPLIFYIVKPFFAWLALLVG